MVYGDCFTPLGRREIDENVDGAVNNAVQGTGESGPADEDRFADLGHTDFGEFESGRTLSVLYVTLQCHEDV